jgi:hypothetical protein
MQANMRQLVTLLSKVHIKGANSVTQSVKVLCNFFTKKILADQQEIKNEIYRVTLIDFRQTTSMPFAMRVLFTAVIIPQHMMQMWS